MIKNSPPPTDQVTVRDLLLYFKGFIQFVYGLLQFGVDILKKYFLLLILAILVGGVWGYLHYKKQADCYEGGITCGYTELHRKIYGEMIVLLNEHLKNHEDTIVAGLLDIDTRIAASLKDLSAVNIAGSPLQNDITPDKAPFYITYKTTDSAFVRPINKGLLFYLQSTQFNKLRREVRLNNAKQKIDFITTQLSMLDSMKLGYIKYLSKGGTVASGSTSEMNVAELFKESETLFNSKQDAEWILKFDNAVETIYEKQPTRVQSDGALYKDILKRGILSFIVVFVLCICWHLSRSIIHEQK